MTGPKTKPEPNAAPIRPKFCARLSGGKRSAMKALAMPKLLADMPAMMRPRNSQPIVGAKPMTR